MGLQEFVDTTPVNGQDRFDSKEGCYIRDVDGDDILPDNFQRADRLLHPRRCNELYRQEKDARFAVQASHHVGAHFPPPSWSTRTIANRIRGVYENSGFDSSVGLQRLKRRWTEDILPVLYPEGR